MLKLWTVAVISFVCIASVQAGERPSVELFHWWVTDGELDALNVVRRHVEAQGLSWQDVPLVDNEKVEYRRELRRRITIGRAPMAAQVIGYDVQHLADEGRLRVLDDIARREQWDEVVPVSVQQLSKHRGHWVAVPINIHSTNWIWVNRELMQRLGLKAPDTWEDLLFALERARAAGIVPLAIGDAAGQHLLLFESVAAGTGGAEFYRRVFLEMRPTRQDVGTLKKVLERMSVLRGYIGPQQRPLTWAQANALVRSRHALMQVQGSWAESEFSHAGLVPGRDYECYRFPDTQGLVLFNSDQIVMFKDAADTPTQDAFASTLMDIALQHELNIVTGSVPARVDVPTAGFNLCGEQAIKDLRAASVRRDLLESFTLGGASPQSPRHRLYSIVSEHFKGRTTDEEALDKLKSALKSAGAE